jgi:hypothetical protein
LADNLAAEGVRAGTDVCTDDEQSGATTNTSCARNATYYDGAAAAVASFRRRSCSSKGGNTFDRGSSPSGRDSLYRAAASSPSSI